MTPLLPFDASSEYQPLGWARLEVALAGRQVHCTVQASVRARHLGLRIAPGTGLIVTAPVGVEEPAVRAFLARHRRWILRWVERLDGGANRSRRWPYGPTLLVRGEPHTVLVRQAPKPGVVQTPNKHVLVSARSRSVEGARRVLRRWLTQEAVPALGERVAVWGAAMAVRPRRVYVRNLRRRWGSCWPGGSLSFNYRLIMAPPMVLDYVVVHELAHLRERNHSPRFWALVSRYAPRHPEAKRWLRICGPALEV